MSIILVNPPTIVSKEWKHSTTIGGIKRYMKPKDYRSMPIEHLGMMSIKAYAMKKGVKINVVNGILLLHSSLQQTLEEIKEIAKVEGDPVLIGFSCVGNFDDSYTMANKCKKIWPDVKIVIGHNFGALNYNEILKNYPVFNFACTGDGETVFTQLAKAVLNNDKAAIEKIPGLAYRGDENCIEHTSPKYPPLNEYPWPCRDELPIALKLGFSAGVMTSRGCPFHCSYCATGNVSKERPYRVRDAEDIVAEIEWLKRDFNVKFINFIDDLFLSNTDESHERAQKIANLLIEKNLKVKFMIDLRVDSIREDTLKLLYKAGLRLVFVGFETGSTKQLLEYKKYYTNCKITSIDAINILQNMGIKVIPGILTFHPKVTPDELRSTLKIIETLKFRRLYSFTRKIVPYVGTLLYDEYKKAGILTKTWPVGDWDFADDNAKKCYEKIHNSMTPRVPSYQKTKKLFLQEINKWESDQRSNLA